MLQTKKWQIPNRCVAAPSWVMQGSILENCSLLEPLVDEVGLLFFDFQACLRGENPVPAELHSLSLSYHMHLPLDLPMSCPNETLQCILALLQKTNSLDLSSLVIHPPKRDAKAFLQNFLALVRESALPPLAWENVSYCDLLNFLELFVEYEQKICLDFGHLLAHQQEALLRRDDLLERVAVFHINAPGPASSPSEHRSLRYLCAEELSLLTQCLKRIPRQATLMLELFRIQDIEESFPILYDCFFDAFPIVWEERY